MPKYPATTGVRAVGSCGHEYLSRQPLPVGLARKVRSADLDELLEVWTATRVNVLSDEPCQECAAGERVAQVEAQVGPWMSWLRLPDLPVLSGSVRQVAFAATLRADAVTRVVRTVETMVLQAYLHPSTHAALASELLASRFPDLSSGWAPDVAGVGEEYLSSRSSLTRKSVGVEGALGVWLATRWALSTRQGQALWGYTDADTWIRYRKGAGRQGGQVDLSGLPRLLPALTLVTGRRDWPDAASMFTAMELLAGEAAGTIPALMAAPAGSVLSELLSSLSVMNALTMSAEQRETLVF